MAKKKIVREMWAIVGQSMWPVCIRWQKKASIKEFIGEQGGIYSRPWSYWKRHGMRCVKVKVVIEEFRS